MKKLYTPRFTSPQNVKQSQKNSTAQAYKSQQIDRKCSEFQEEFIPLKQDTAPPSPSLPSVDPKPTRTRPYPADSIQRVQKHIQAILNTTTYYESNQTCRMIEIIKLKLNMKSKFENDQRLIRMIERDKRDVKKNIEERIDSIDKRLNLKRAKNNHIVIELNSSSEDEKKEAKRVEKYQEEYEDVDEREDIKDIMRFIDEEDKVIYLSGDEVEEDSKCHQYGKYTANKRHTHSSNKVSTNPNMHLRVNQKAKVLNKEKLDFETVNREYKSLKNRKIKLRKIRNKNKLSNIEINQEKGEIIADMRRNRAQRRRLIKSQAKFKKSSISGNNNKSSSTVQLFQQKSISNKQNLTDSASLLRSDSFKNFSNSTKVPKHKK